MPTIYTECQCVCCRTIIIEKTITIICLNPWLRHQIIKHQRWPWSGHLAQFWFNFNPLNMWQLRYRQYINVIIIIILLCVCKSVCVWECVYVCVSMCVSLPVCVCTYVSVYVFLSVGVCVSMHASTCAWVCQNDLWVANSYTSGPFLLT